MHTFPHPTLPLPNPGLLELSSVLGTSLADSLVQSYIAHTGSVISQHGDLGVDHGDILSLTCRSIVERKLMEIQSSEQLFSRISTECQQALITLVLVCLEVSTSHGIQYATCGRHDLLHW